MTMAEQCAVCGEGSTMKKTKTDRLTYGEGELAPVLAVEVPVYTCQDCGAEYLDDEGEDARGRAVTNLLNWARQYGAVFPGDAGKDA
jgi:YgiT-type zinc finger domain-containing protein